MQHTGKHAHRSRSRVLRKGGLRFKKNKIEVVNQCFLVNFEGQIPIFCIFSQFCVVSGGSVPPGPPPPPL